MSVEAPADICILGLNRQSIEAGLYARFLGYQVTLAGNGLVVSPASDLAEFAWQKSTSTLGRRALEAQGCPPTESSVGGSQDDNCKLLIKDYLRPLLQSDLLTESVMDSIGSIQIRIGESEPPAEQDDDVEYDLREFQIVMQTRDRNQVAVPLTADVVIDCRASEELESLPAVFDFDTAWREAVFTATDDFYVLGQRLHLHRPDGGSTPFGFVDALSQIRDLFQVLCDRETLDLYAH